MQKGEQKRDDIQLIGSHVDWTQALSIKYHQIGSLVFFVRRDEKRLRVEERERRGEERRERGERRGERRGTLAKSILTISKCPL